MKKLCLFIVSVFYLLSFTAHADALNRLLHQPGDPVIGNPKGKITVVEFYDYQCGHCVSMADTMAAVIKANPNVRFVFKDFPIRGTMSNLAARAAVAANMQGKYYPFAHALLTTSSPLSQAVIMNIAKQAGLNVARLQKDMNSAAVLNLLRNNYHLAQELGINGTPAFVVGPSNATSLKSLDLNLGEMSQSELQSAINKFN